MKGIPVVSVLIMVVALVLAIVISSSKLMPLREEMYKQVPKRLENVYMPMLGIDKFYADVQWIGLLQEMGDPEVKMGTDDKGKQMAGYYYQQLDRLTDLSPDTEKYYDFGAMHIAHLQPEKAIALLQKGNDLCSKKTWKRSHLCAHITTNFIGRRAESDEAKMAATEEAAKYLKEAMDFGGYPSYVESSWLRKRAEIKGIDNNELSVLKLWYDYYKEKIAQSLEAEREAAQEAREMTAEAGAEAAPDAGAEGEMAAEEGGEMMYEDGVMSEVDEDLRNRIMQKAQDLALTYWKQADDAAKKNMQVVRKIFYDIAPDGHYSDVSLRSYNPGDFYDIYTGTRVKPYGISYAAWDSFKQIVQLRGDFCHVTGQSREESEKQWEAWWQEHRNGQ